MKETPEPRQIVLTLRILVGALLFGLLAISVVAALLGEKPLVESSVDPALYAWILVALGAVVLVVWAFADRLRPDLETSPGGPPPELAAYSARIVLRAALAEGWGVFGGTCALITGNPWFLAAPALAAAALVTLLPNEERVRRLMGSAGPEADRRGAPIEP